MGLLLALFISCSALDGSTDAMTDSNVITIGLALSKKVFCSLDSSLWYINDYVFNTYIRIFITPLRKIVRATVAC